MRINALSDSNIGVNPLSAVNMATNARQGALSGTHVSADVGSSHEAGAKYWSQPTVHGGGGPARLRPSGPSRILLGRCLGTQLTADEVGVQAVVMEDGGHPRLPRSSQSGTCHCRGALLQRAAGFQDQSRHRAGVPGHPSQGTGPCTGHQMLIG